MREKEKGREEGKDQTLPTKKSSSTPSGCDLGVYAPAMRKGIFT